MISCQHFRRHRWTISYPSEVETLISQSVLAYLIEVTSSNQYLQQFLMSLDVQWFQRVIENLSLMRCLTSMSFKPRDFNSMAMGSRYLRAYKRNKYPSRIGGKRRRGPNESRDKDSLFTKCHRSSRRVDERVEVRDRKLSLKADESEIDQQRKDVEKGRNYYDIIIFPERTWNFT